MSLMSTLPSARMFPASVTEEIGKRKDMLSDLARKAVVAKYLNLTSLRQEGG